MRPARPKQWGPGAMAKKLKTYTTSAGFFDLAIAAPSMKAALEAWGSRINLFHQGFARESDDPATVAATMAKPGVVLRRAVGSSGKFGEDAQLPTDLPTKQAAALPISKARKKAAEPAPKRPAAKKREPAPTAARRQGRPPGSPRLRERAEAARNPSPG